MAQYDQIAKSYEKLMGQGGDIPRRSIIDPIMISLLPNSKNLIVLDAGCGNGYWTKLLSKRYKKVIGVDNSRKLLRIIKDKHFAPNIEYKLIDLEGKTSFKDKTFNFIFSNMVLHYIKNIDNFAKEMYRLLKNNGSILLSMTHPIYESTRNPSLKDIQTRIAYKSATLGGLAELTIQYESSDLIIRHFLNVGFKLIQQRDAIITSDAAQRYPRYKGYSGVPRALILLFKK